MNKKTTIELVVLSAALALSLIVNMSMIVDLRSATEKLSRLRSDREEVKRIERFIEQRSPRMHPATRRGYAEWTVEAGWPVDEKIK